MLKSCSDLFWWAPSWSVALSEVFGDGCLTSFGHIRQTSAFWLDLVRLPKLGPTPTPLPDPSLAIEYGGRVLSLSMHFWTSPTTVPFVVLSQPIRSKHNPKIDSRIHYLQIRDSCSPCCSPNTSVYFIPHQNSNISACSSQAEMAEVKMSRRGSMITTCWLLPFCSLLIRAVLHLMIPSMTDSECNPIREILAVPSMAA